MRISQVASIEKHLSDFVSKFSDVLGQYRRMKQCAHYLCGLLLDGDRKSIEPMVSRVTKSNAQALQQFIADSPWDYESLQSELIEFMKHKLRPRIHHSVLILDDTSFPKKGKSSVGVARQYCGALGKVANCQSIVSWHYSQGNPPGLHLPLLTRLYLPKEWTRDANRLKKAKIPGHYKKFKQKWRIALELLDQIATVLPHEVCIFDAGYGEIREFLGGLDARNEYFITQVPTGHGFWPQKISIRDEQPPTGRPRKHAEVITPHAKCLTVKQWFKKLLRNKKKWRSIRLPDQRKTKVIVASVRVREKIRLTHRGVGPERWLLIERHPDGSIKYYLSNFPESTPIRKIIQLAHGRYKVEQGYQFLKEELGMDHYEGRSWIGLHHHITLCFMAYDFLVLMQKHAISKKKSTTVRPVQKFVASNAA